METMSGARTKWLLPLLASFFLRYFLSNSELPDYSTHISGRLYIFLVIFSIHIIFFAFFNSKHTGLIRKLLWLAVPASVFAGITMMFVTSNVLPTEPIQKILSFLALGLFVLASLMRVLQKNQPSIDIDETDKSRRPFFIRVSGIISTLALLFILFFVFAFLEGFGHLDKRVANKIPEYPSATLWDIYSSSGFPDGRPSAGIYFYSADAPREVVDFYKNELSEMEVVEESLKSPFDAEDNVRDILIQFRDGRYSVILNTGFYSGARPYNGGNYWFSISH